MIPDPPPRDPEAVALDERLAAADRELDALFLEEVAAVLLRLCDADAAARDDAAA